eukprot:5518871-Pyramimonas_sp.AAC.1
MVVMVVIMVVQMIVLVTVIRKQSWAFSSPLPRWPRSPPHVAGGTAGSPPAGGRREPRRGVDEGPPESFNVLTTP